MIWTNDGSFTYVNKRHSTLSKYKPRTTPWHGDFPPILAFCEGNSPVTNGFASQRVQKWWAFMIFFIVCCWKTVELQIKENINAPRHWPLWGEFTGSLPAQYANNAENASIWWRIICIGTPRKRSCMKTYQSWDNFYSLTFFTAIVKGGSRIWS